MCSFNFAPATSSEQTIYGAARPGRNRASPDRQVDEWIDYMRGQGIERVCVLAGETLGEYTDLLGQYRAAFGAKQVVHAPVPEFEPLPEAVLTETIVPALRAADRAESPIVVHCSAGVSRTGQVHVLWLAAERDYTLEAAIQAVKVQRRTPLTAATREDLRRLLEAVRG